LFLKQPFLPLEIACLVVVNPEKPILPEQEAPEKTEGKPDAPAFRGKVFSPAAGSQHLLSVVAVCSG
jgi:hypothetical protein